MTCRTSYTYSLTLYRKSSLIPRLRVCWAETGAKEPRMPVEEQWICPGAHLDFSFLSYPSFSSFKLFCLLNRYPVLSHHTSCPCCCSLLRSSLHLSITEDAGNRKMLSYHVTSPPGRVILRIKSKLPCLLPGSPLALSATLPGPFSCSSALHSALQPHGSTCSSLNRHSLSSFCA